MAWQILAMWMIVMATIVWFVRDERRLIANAAMAQAAQFYASAPQYSYQQSQTAVAANAPTVRRTGGLSSKQREFLKAYSQTA